MLWGEISVVWRNVFRGVGRSLGLFTSRAEQTGAGHCLLGTLIVIVLSDLWAMLYKGLSLDYCGILWVVTDVLWAMQYSGTPSCCCPVLIIMYTQALLLSLLPCVGFISYCLIQLQECIFGWCYFIGNSSNSCFHIYLFCLAQAVICFELVIFPVWGCVCDQRCVWALLPNSSVMLVLLDQWLLLFLGEIFNMCVYFNFTGGNYNSLNCNIPVLFLSGLNWISTLCVRKYIYIFLNI